jgi:hypothetical protein
MKQRAWILAMGLLGWSLALAGVRDTADAQRKLAEDQWKELFSDKPPAFLETEHFFLFGTVTPKMLDDCGKAAEKALPVIKRTLRLDKTPAWKGKLVIFLLRERGEFASFARNLAKRNPDREDRGGFFHLPQWSLVTVGPAATNKSLPYDLEAVQYVAAAAITKEYGENLPEWLVSGYGRSVAYRAQPKAFTEERQLAQRLLAGKHVRDVLAGNLTREEGPVLNASLVDFLANGAPQNPGMFQSILIAYGLQLQNPTLEQAFTATRLTPDGLDAGWRSFAAKAK